MKAGVVFASTGARAVALTGLLVGLRSAAQTIRVDPENYHRPARFRVTTGVVQRDVQPFTATVGAFGNALETRSFEPAVYRTRFFAEGDAPDRILLNPSAATHYDVLREGFYDGAAVRVYRIVDGKVRIVRQDQIPEGGSAMSGWLRTGTNDRQLLSPQQTRIEYRFDDWNRPDVPYYFTVTAIDTSGNESGFAQAVTVVKSGKGKGQYEKPRIISFRVKRDAEDQDPPPVPEGLRATFDEARDVAVLTWTPAAAKDLAGYRLYRSDYPPNAHRGFHLQLAGGTPKDAAACIRKGDWVVLDKTFFSFSRRRYHSNRVYGSHENKAAMPDGVPFFPDEDPGKTWALDPYPPDTPVKDGGQTALKVVLKEGASVRFDKYDHAGTGQSWYPVLEPGKPYVVEFWARQEGMTDPVATFKLNGFYRRSVEPITFTLDGTWHKFVGEFTVSTLYEGSGGVGQTALEMKGPGTVWLDNYRVYRRDARFLDYLPYEYQDLRQSGMTTLRTHGFIKTKTSTYSMQQLTNPAGAITGVRRGNTLPQTLAMMKRAGVQPWLQIEMHMAPEEWRGFVEYLAAPYDPARDTPQTKPWAYKRYRQGQARPWTDEFQRIYFEISNETWNWLFKPWVFEAMTDGATGTRYDRGQVYGLFQEHVIDCLKSSPYWASAGLDDTFRFVLGGWRVQRYGLKAVTTSPRSQFVTRAGYNGGWDEGEGPAEGNDPSLFRALVQAGQSAIPNAIEMRRARDALVAEGHPPFALGTYEAGPGYALSGLNKQAKMSKEQVRAQEETMKSLGAGTATLDTFLGRAVYGYAIQNFFTYYHGKTHWVSHTAWHKGPLAHPCWLALTLFNNHAAGDMLNVESESVPTVDLPKYKRRAARADIPLVSVYATRAQDRVSVFVLSRKLDGYPATGDDGCTPVTVDLPFGAAKKVTLYRLAGDPRSHNLDRKRVRIEEVALAPESIQKSFSLTDKTGADARGLPPGSTFLYVFEGVDMPAGTEVPPPGL